MQLHRWGLLIFCWLIAHLFSGTWQMEDSTCTREVWTECQTRWLPGTPFREGFTTWQSTQTGSGIGIDMIMRGVSSNLINEVLGVLQYKWKEFYFNTIIILEHLQNTKVILLQDFKTFKTLYTKKNALLVRIFNFRLHGSKIWYMESKI